MDTTIFISDVLFISFNLLGRGESCTVQIAESIEFHCYVTKLFYIFIFICIIQRVKNK